MYKYILCALCLLISSSTYAMMWLLGVQNSARNIGLSFTVCGQTVRLDNGESVVVWTPNDWDPAFKRGQLKDSVTIQWNYKLIPASPENFSPITERGMYKVTGEAFKKPTLQKVGTFTGRTIVCNTNYIK